ncbi:MAG: DUF3087 family protein [Halomonas sp.]|uniref:DUF3087 family protein n=1 Tax=Halomonas sp. TaxID=1486246 RepID=UPI003F90049B
MAFYFEDHEPERYRRLTRLVGMAMAAMLIVFSLIFTQLRHKAWMEPISYSWRLKQRLSRVSGYLPALRRGLEERDPSALTVLSFYHQGMAQLTTLDGRAMDDATELLAERQQVRLARLELGLSERVEGLSDADLARFKRG